MLIPLHKVFYEVKEYSVILRMFGSNRNRTLIAFLYDSLFTFLMFRILSGRDKGGESQHLPELDLFQHNQLTTSRLEILK